MPCIEAKVSIFVKTGEFAEVLPIVVPENTAIIGDELRSTKIIAANATTPATDTANTVATFDRIASIVSDVVTGTTVTTTAGNVEPQSQNWPLAVTTQSEKVSSLVDLMKYQIDYGLKTMAAGYYTDPTGYASTLENARTNLIANKDFYNFLVSVSLLVSSAFIGVTISDGVEFTLANLLFSCSF